jgi:hypothetical protein
VVPKVLQENPTTGTRKHYDQIGFKTKSEVIEYVESRSRDPLKRNAGVVSLFDNVFSKSQFDDYVDAVKKSSAGKNAENEAELKDVYLDWRTYQFSDHYPMWVRLQTDGADAYLHRLAQNA